MFAKTTKTVLACILLSACAPIPALRTGHGALRTSAIDERTLPDTPDTTDESADVSARTDEDRFRFVDQNEDGLQQVLLVPTAVAAVAAAGPLSRSRVFVGALFASQRVDGDRVAGVGLVIKTIGGGLGATLSDLPRVVGIVDGNELFRGSLARSGLYRAERGRWGLEETLMFRIRHEAVRAMAQGSEVELRLGASVRVRLDDEQIVDLADFLDRIPEDARFDVTHELGAAPGARTQ